MSRTWDEGGNFMLENLKKLASQAKENVGFLLIAVLVVALIIGVAYLAETLIKKTKKESDKQNQRVRRMTLIAMLSAISTVLMLFDFPLWFVPSFYKMDFSEFPAVIGAFALGPVAGVWIEFIKVFLNLFLNGTDTAFVGEFASFVMGSCFIVPASIVYYAKKTKKTAVIGLVGGTLISILAGCLLNAYLLIPTYSRLFHMDLSVIIGMGTEKNGSVNGLFTFVTLLVAPFNLFKYSVLSIITMFSYKRISRLLKG